MKHTNTVCGGKCRVSLFVKGMVHAFVTVPCTDYGTSHVVSKYAQISLVHYKAKRSREVDFVCSLRSTEIMLVQ